MFSPRQQRADGAGAELRLAADAGRAETGSVKGVPERHGFEPSGGGAGDFQGDFHRIGAAGGEQDFIQSRRTDVDQLAGQINRRFTGEAARGE